MSLGDRPPTTILVHELIELLAFGRAVNVTLGLPIVRTSVDHSTGFDIAGQGVADSAAVIAAVRLAARLAAMRSAATVSG